MSKVFVIQHKFANDKSWSILCVCDQLSVAQMEIANEPVKAPYSRLVKWDDYRFQILDENDDFLRTFVIWEHELITFRNPRHVPENCESCQTLVRHGFPDTEQVC